VHAPWLYTARAVLVLPAAGTIALRMVPDRRQPLGFRGLWLLSMGHWARSFLYGQAVEWAGLFLWHHQRQLRQLLLLCSRAFPRPGMVASGVLLDWGLMTGFVPLRGRQL